ncbi:MAG TPA: prolyl oligopeptidase family serine peptidase, partial [Parasegetibacter sp.]
LYTEEQKTWISLDETNRFTFLSNNKGFILQSDKTGWNQLYLHDMNGKLINRITDGNFTVTDIVKIDEKKQVIYFTARKENTARVDLYSIKMNGKDMKRLTTGDYTHTVNLSPQGNYFISTFSNASTPTKVALYDNKGNMIRLIADAKGSNMDEYNIAKTELIRVKSDDGLYDLPAVVTWPLNMDKNKKYPVLISIYGGPGAGTVMDRFNLNPTQQWFAQEGLIQIAMDHRASGHFGKEGINYMYRNLGYWEIKDYSTIVRHLINNGADPERICITGFSYGGYLSAYALTYGADVFTHGMAGGSVIDWTLYDTHYTERFMDTPKDNPEGYKSSSVLTHAHKYKGVLQLVHGAIDENVHLQNTMQLVSKLQDLNKDFELMIYPGNRHGIGGVKGNHYQNLKTKFIYKYLLKKEVPRELIR